MNAFEDPKHPEVQLEVLKTIAPYLMYHRVEPNEMVLARAPYSGMKLKFLEDVVDRATQGYSTVKDALKEVPKVLRGEVAPESAAVNEIDKDLVVKSHFRPLVEEAGSDEFRRMYDEIEGKEMKGEVLRDVQRRLALTTELKPHAQKYLLSKAMAKARKEDYI